MHDGAGRGGRWGKEHAIDGVMGFEWFGSQKEIIEPMNLCQSFCCCPELCFSVGPPSSIIPDHLISKSFAQSAFYKFFRNQFNGR